MTISQTEINKLYRYSEGRRKSSKHANDRKMNQQELQDVIDELESDLSEDVWTS